MKAIGNILLALSVVCFIIAVVSKLTGEGLYNLDIKPISALVFGNTCLLVYLVIKNLKS